MGYEWQPQTPDRLLQLRKNPDTFRPLVQWLGLGYPVTADELLSDGLNPGVLANLDKEGFIREACAAMAVSGQGELFIIHDHWPPRAGAAAGYAHYAAESAWLARRIRDDLEGFIGKRVLDLGCSSGALSFEVIGVAEEVMGLDVSARAIEWARVAAQAHGFKNIFFEAAAVGTPDAERAVGPKPFDVVIMNPPMVVPSKDAAYPHRDGGALGIELPLKFLEFSSRHLKKGGEVHMFATNPIVSGRPKFFDELATGKFGKWETLYKHCAHSHFNQEVARKQGYDKLGIERIELFYLHFANVI